MGGRAFLDVGVWACKEEAVDNVNDVIGRILLIPWPVALAHAGVYDFLPEITGDGVVSYYTSYKGHDDGAICVSIASLQQSFQEAVHKLYLLTIDLDTGVGEGGLQFAYVAPALYLSLHLHEAPQVTQFLTAP